MSPVEELLSKLLRPLKLLCVEDEQALAGVMRNQLSQHYECEVDWAQNGEDALEMAKRVDYDLILLDLVLPGMNGVEVLKSLKESHPAVPVIVMTGFYGSDLAIEASRHGVICMLAKPFVLTDFEEVFRLFKIRVRSKEDEKYFQSRCSNAVLAGSV